MSGHAFLSYIDEDTSKVDALHAGLEHAKILVWRDKDNLWPGDDWKRQIRRAIQSDALAFLCCFSKQAANRHKSVQRDELLFAIDEGRKLAPGTRWIIPVRLDDCEVPDYDLGAGRLPTDLNWVNLFGSYASELDRLIHVVVNLVGAGTERAAASRSSWDRAYVGRIRPGTDDIDEFVDFAVHRMHVMVSLDLAIDALGSKQPTVSQSDERDVIMVPNAVDGDFECGAEVLIHDLASASDAAMYFEHGHYILRGRFLIHGVAGPHQGVMSVSIRAVDAA